MSDVLKFIVDGKRYKCASCEQTFAVLADHNWAQCAIDSGRWYMVTGTETKH